ncbi:MAG: excalibur calcium-binding domain-containing protein [Lysobacter sp.]|nr:MAG: excalibur calcium-binding domain-containing protein [Lysobacter sp.]
MAVFILACIALDTEAHGGRLNAEGCHHDRKRGGYHCHGGGATASRSRANSSPRYDFSPSRAAPVRRVRGGVFANCAEARAAGAAPLRRGDPGYGPHLDRDGDGVGCEPRRR